MEDVLNELFRYGHHECLVTTLGRDGTVNVAPMGVDYMGGYLVIKPYINTKTYENLLLNNEAVINLTNDSVLYYDSLLNRKGLKFIKSLKVKVPRIDGAVDYYIECVLDKYEHLGKDRAMMFLRPIHMEIGRGSKLAYSRANTYLLEMLIYYTKLKAFIEYDAISEALRTFTKVNYYFSELVRLRPTEPLMIRARSLFNESLNMVIKAILSKT